jgi:hypothetical protein
MGAKFWGTQSGGNRTAKANEAKISAERDATVSRQQKGLNPLTEDQQQKVLDNSKEQGFKNVYSSGDVGFVSKEFSINAGLEGAKELSKNYRESSLAPSYDISSNSAYRQQLALRKSQSSTRLGG